MNIEEINKIIKGLPRAALNLVPDDAVLMLLVGQMPETVTRENAKQAITLLSLICRRLADCFNDLAVEQETLLKEWRSYQL